MVTNEGPEIASSRRALSKRSHGLVRTGVTHTSERGMRGSAMFSRIDSLRPERPTR